MQAATLIQNEPSLMAQFVAWSVETQEKWQIRGKEPLLPEVANILVPYQGKLSDIMNTLEDGTSRAGFW